jgi:hypothetical protein
MLNAYSQKSHQNAGRDVDGETTYYELYESIGV